MKRKVVKKPLVNWVLGGQANAPGQKQPSAAAVRKYVRFLEKNAVGKRRPLL